MQNYIKTPAEIEAMREGGKVLASILKDLKAYAKPGMTGKEIDTWVENEIKKEVLILLIRIRKLIFLE